MRLLRVLFGLIAMVTGVVLGIAAVAMFVDDQHGVAVFQSILAVVFFIVGKGWLRSKNDLSWRNDPATEKQKSFADDLGIKYRKNITKGELSDLISEATGK